MPRFERLTPEHLIESFASGNADLDIWLRAAGVTADRAGTARVPVRASVVHVQALWRHPVKFMQGERVDLHGWRPSAVRTGDAVRVERA